MRAALPIFLLAGCATSAWEDMPRLERDVKLALVRHAPEAKLRLWLARADGRELLAIDADGRVPAASTIKILLLVEGHAQEREGTFRWTDPVTLLEEDKVGGAGSLQRERAGSTWTYLQFARRMIAESDNTASNILLRRFDARRVNARARELGLEVTRFERLFMDDEARRAGRENWTTAREMGELCRLILRREAVSREASDEMAAVLERTSRSRIAAGVPRIVPVGHKGGTLPGLRHDVGWVRVEGSPYVLSIFLDNVLERPGVEADRGNDAIEAISRVVFAALGPGDE